MVICHIVGFNEKIKNKFIEEIDDNIITKDLDDISQKIINSKQLININNKIEDYKKRKNNNRKILEKEYNEKWKIIFNKKIDNICKKNKGKNIIFIGLTTHHKNIRMRIKINTVNTFLCKTNFLVNAKETIEYNLDNYRKYIINGSFPIKYLDCEFLTKQHEKINNVYKSFGYIEKSYGMIQKWIKTNIKCQSGGEKEKEMDSAYYVGSQTKYDNIIGNKNVRSIRKNNRNKIRLLLDMEDTHGSIDGY